MEYTKFEKARIIGARALQLSMGAPLMIKLTKRKLEELRYSVLEIAKLELKKDVIPITAKRTFPHQRIRQDKPEKSTSEKDTKQNKQDEDYIEQQTPVLTETGEGQKIEV